MASAVTRVAQTPSSSTTTTLWSRAITNIQADKKLGDILKSITQQTTSSQPPQDIASTVLTKIRQRELEIENKKWSVSFGSTQLVISDCYSKVAGAVLRFKDLGSALAGLDAKAGTPWACTVAMLELSLADFKQHELLAKALGATTRLLPVYAVLESEIAARKDPSLKDEVTDRVVDLYTKVLNCQLLALKYFQKRSPARSFQSVFKPEDWQARIDDIHKADADCQRIISSLQFQNDRLAAEGLTCVRKWQRQQDESQRSLHERGQTAAILRWLCPNNPAADHASLLERTGTDHQFAGRGQWLLASDDYEKWANSTTQSNSILWIKGSMGTGKTTLATLIVEHEVGRRSLNSYDSFAMFYCIGKAVDSSVNDCVSVLGALLRQLACSSSSGGLHTSVITAFQNRREGGRDPSRPSLRLCKDMFTEVMAGSKEVTIVIDALDESNNPEVLLAELEDLLTSSPSSTCIRICLLSRRDVDVLGWFPNCCVIDVDQIDRAIDMKYYIRQTVASRKPRLLRGRHPDIEDNVVDRLCNASHGMFRWAQLQLEILYHPKMKFRTPGAVKDFLSNIEDRPSSDDLTAAYDTIFDLNASHEVDRDLAIRCYKFVLSVQWECTFDGLSHVMNAASSEDAVDADTIRTLTANILLEDADGDVQFVHFSAQSYLLDRIDAEGQKMFSSEACHAETAIICLTILSRSTWNVPEEYAYSSRTVAEKEDVAAYSGLWWGEHARLGCTDSCASLQLESILHYFFLGSSEALYRWQRYLSRTAQKASRFSVHYRKFCQCRTAPPLTVACAWGLPRTVDTILNDKIQWKQIYVYNDDRYRNTDYKKSAIMAASGWGQIACVDLLVSKLRTLHNEEELRWYLNEGLLEAVSGIQLEAMKQLLRMGADANAKDPTTGRTPLVSLLFVASYEDSRRVVEAAYVLLEYGADPNARRIDARFETDLEIACWRDDADMVKLLLSYKAIPTSTAIENAAKQGNLATVKMLFDAGADPRSTKALGWAVQEKATNVINFLINKGCDVNQLVDELPLLLRAIENCDITTVRLLVAGGADIGCSFKGTNALEYAIEALAKAIGEDSDFIVELAPYFYDRFKRPLLIAAIKESNLTVVRLLLARGADIGCTFEGMNALECARHELAENARLDFEWSAKRLRRIVGYLEKQPYFVALEAEEPYFHNLFNERWPLPTSEGEEGISNDDDADDDDDDDDDWVTTSASQAESEDDSDLSE